MHDEAVGDCVALESLPQGDCMWLAPGLGEGESMSLFVIVWLWLGASFCVAPPMTVRLLEALPTGGHT